jgi:hypothetical protein
MSFRSATWFPRQLDILILQLMHISLSMSAIFVFEAQGSSLIWASNGMLASYLLLLPSLHQHQLLDHAAQPA